VKKLRCIGLKSDGSRCTREKEFEDEQAPKEWRCWQHPVEKNNDLDLTEKQKAFADEYIISLNATDAAIKAGYSKNSAKEIGHENLTKPHIKKYIEKRLKEKEAARIATQDEVLEYLTEVMRGEKDEVDIFFDDRGQEREIRQPPKIRERTKAAELLGKRYAIFVDKKELEINELPTINLVRGKENGG
jgi:phage terminase small subunit